MKFITNLSEFHKRLAKTDEFPMYIKMPLLTLSSWLLQSILYMDTTERVFKILVDVLLFFPLHFVIRGYCDTPVSIFMAIIVAHTINWIFNGQIFVLLKNLGIIKTEPERFIQYLDNLQKRIKKEDYILAAAAFGSLSRGQLNVTSDLDIRIIRKKGLVNGIRASLFVLMERTRSLFSKFPLDIYLLDSFKHLSKLRCNEPPIILSDTKAVFREYYGKREVILWKE